MNDNEIIPLQDRRGTEEFLRAVVEGDLIHGRDSLSASLICLVTLVDKESIHCRRITTQQVYQFDKITGTALPNGSHKGGKIDSVEPLPIDIHNTLVGLERRHRLGKRTAENMRLTAEEKKALFFVHDHYQNFQI